MMGHYSKMNSQAVKLRELLVLAPDLSPTSPLRQSKQRQTRLSTEGLTAFSTAYLSGASAQELAQRFNIHRATVFEIVKRQGLPKRSVRLTPADVEVATRMYESGNSLLSVGQHFGLAADTVALALRKAGVEIRARRGHGAQRRG